SLAVRPGEVVGVAGATGSGRGELWGLGFGSRRRVGPGAVGGAPVPAVRPDRSVAGGVGFVPGDRRARGLIMNMAIRENLTLVDLRAYWRRGWLSYRRELRDVARLRHRYGVRGSRDEAAVSSRSGGNHLKLCLGKW